MAQEQLMTAAEEANEDAFDAMMSALDVFFHVAVCPNHSKEERQDALKQAKETFAAYVGYDPLTGPEDMAPGEPVETVTTPSPSTVLLYEGNAPTSNKVH